MADLYSKDYNMNFKDTPNKLEIQNFTKVVQKLTKFKEYKPISLDEETQTEVTYNKSLKSSNSTLNFIKTNWRTFLPITLIILSAVFYVLSLKGCSSDIDIALCLKENDESINILIFTYLCISIGLNVILVLMLLFKTMKFYYILIEFAIMMYLFNIDKGFDLKNHGGYNYLIFVVLFILSLILFFFVYWIVKVLRKHPKKTTFIGLTIIFSLYFSFNYMLQDSCKGWDINFKNTKIVDDSSCILKRPKYCIQHIFDGVFDFTKILKLDCVNKPNDIWPYGESNNKLGFIRTEHIPVNDTISFPWKVQSSMVEPNNKQVSEKIEAFVIRDPITNTGNIEITLKFQPEVMKKSHQIRSLLDPIKSKNDPKNILILFIDSVSRVHFKRKLPLTFKFLEGHYKNEKSSLSSFQFMKFHAINRYTTANMFPFFYGIDHSEKNITISQKSDSFMQYYKDKGYVTGSTFNMCSKEFMNTYGTPIGDYISHTPSDHMLHSIGCDPNFIEPNNMYFIWSGHYSMREHCLYKKNLLEYNLDYATQFFEKYDENYKIFKIGLIDGHEGTGEVIKTADKLLESFLVKMFTNNGPLSTNSMLFFLSDHHMTMPGLYSLLNSDDWRTELYLPFLYVMITKDIPNYSLYEQNLSLNENNLFTAYDCHIGFLSLIDVQPASYKVGRSIFKEDLKNNSCSKYKDLDQNECRCMRKDL